MSSDTGEDTMVKDAASSDRELIENGMADINLHAVESISDLHYASSGRESARVSEGGSPSQPNSPWTPHSTSSKHFTFPNEEDTSFLPVQNLHLLPAFTCCPCFSPTCCPTSFFALLGVLVVASLGLATLAVYLSDLHNSAGVGECVVRKGTAHLLSCRTHNRTPLIISANIYAACNS
ncbi:leucine-rich single-pass membrane protein 2 isoform X2 [Zootoca vivipara]|uniref:leucine-rich single-pass membrane protein 2 isoform X2 n=1 Tax=Zootoca vivipara TaxID=8524 RepID=UPI00293B8974|nr:leucine-rich single-pass membrane protein 2 isoform X2 [Zootoca vivipara]